MKLDFVRAFYNGLAVPTYGVGVGDAILAMNKPNMILHRFPKCVFNVGTSWHRPDLNVGRHGTKRSCYI